MKMIHGLRTMCVMASAGAPTALADDDDDDRGRSHPGYTVSANDALDIAAA